MSLRSKSLSAFFVLVASLLAPAAASAQKVALVHTDSPTFAADVQSKLLATGAFSQVDLIDASSSTPTLATLKQYDALLTWSNANFHDGAALGDVLADYVDLGGGVVQAPFSLGTRSIGTAPDLDGRWETGGYLPFTEGTLFAAGPVTLVPDQPAHPILLGVVDVALIDGFMNAPISLMPGTTLVAHWSNGEPLVGVRDGPVQGRIVGLNLFPPSSDAQDGFWDATTDGAQLMANALRFVAQKKIALVHAEILSWAADVQSKLLATGAFRQVDLIDASSSTPTLATLLQYNAVLTWSNDDFHDGAALGDVLADYVDLGGGVVQAPLSFGNRGFGTAPDLDGRWETGGYLPFTEGTLFAAGAVTLVPDQPAHAILLGVLDVALIDGVMNAPISLLPGTTLVAHWSSGEPLVGVRDGPVQGRIVGLNLFPPSSDAQSNLWDATTDGAQLMTNALLYVSALFPVDTTPPVVTVPEDISAEATSPSGAVVTFSSSATDAVDGAVFTTCAPASGSVFPLGVTIVTCSAIDVRGNLGQATFSVTVVDTTPPACACTPSRGGLYTVTASDAVGTVTITLGSFTLTSGETIKITVSSKQDGVTPVKTSPAGIRHFRIGPGVQIVATDEAGNVTAVTCGGSS